MRSSWTLLSTLAFSLISVANAHSAPVAVMPVQAVNLSEGQGDAIGVLFANALARDARVAVVSPIESRKVRAQTQTSKEAAERLGADMYVELTAVQLGSTVTLAGVLYDKDARAIYRTAVKRDDLDSMDGASAELAHALVVRQPAPSAISGGDEGAAGMPPVETAVVPVVEEPPKDPNRWEKAYGFISGLSMPAASGKSYQPMINFGFDGRVGPRSYFIEVGAAIAWSSERSATAIRVVHAFASLGAGVFLSSGNAALYLGGGFSPAIWSSSRGDYFDSNVYSESHTSATCAAYGQLGATFSRDSRVRFFTEVRAWQLLLPVADSYRTSSDSTATTVNESYRPSMLSILIGLGF